MNSRREVPTNFNIENARPPYPDYRYFEFAQEFPFRARAAVFDLVNGWWLIEASTLAYAGKDLAEKHFRRVGFSEVELFDKDGTECYVAHNAESAVVAFRGTEARPEHDESGKADFTNVAADVLTDINVKLVESGQGGRVHAGFKTALDKLWDETPLHPLLKELSDQGKRIWFTGHSLGAALATLAADRFGNVAGLYTFGSPRVGDESFRDDFFVPTYRFVNNNDVVCRVPPPPHYVHVGQLKYIDRAGKIHEDATRWERLIDRLAGHADAAFNSLGRLRIGFKGQLPDGIADHVPILYAGHILNSLA